MKNTLTTLALLLTVTVSAQFNRTKPIFGEIVDTSYIDFKENWEIHEANCDWQTAYYLISYLNGDSSASILDLDSKKYKKYVKKQIRQGNWESYTDFDDSISRYYVYENEEVTIYMYDFVGDRCYFYLFFDLPEDFDPSNVDYVSY